MLVTITSGVKLNFKGRSPLVATTCQWKHTTYSMQQPSTVHLY